MYRDDDGAVHAVSAKRMHLGCIVTWNSVERLWDCSCHASRFATDGTVFHGPAKAPLAAVELNEDTEPPMANRGTWHEPDQDRR